MEDKQAYAIKFALRGKPAELLTHLNALTHNETSSSLDALGLMRHTQWGLALRELVISSGKHSISSFNKQLSTFFLMIIDVYYQWFTIKHFLNARYCYNFQELLERSVVIEWCLLWAQNGNLCGVFAFPTLPYPMHKDVFFFFFLVCFKLIVRKLT